ncbi:hypothetical protein Hypma_010758 [Hypsizygus marmoreus]|uniref:Uncharacterized protein n=1 Tax=Hypsizygus marmoreus TaxID=39966 RepID=A0A369JTR8_HYPMA|nr:hypothetical protein Hypma_010758 [Hypsizygus marmoreus]
MPRVLSIDSDHFDMPPRATSPHKHDHRAADISRLLDPSYSSSSYASSSAYVDRDGDLHDPDFRHFPIPHPSGSTNRRHSPHAYAYGMATRPRWELIDEDALDDEDEDMDFVNSRNNTLRHQHSSHSGTFSAYNNNQRPPYTVHRTPTPTYSHHNAFHFHHHPQPLPHSYDSEDTFLDEYDEDAVFVGGGGGDKDTKAHGVSRIILRTKREFSKRRRSLDACSRRSTDSSSPYSPTLPTPETPAPTSLPDADALSLTAPSHHHPLSHTLSQQSHSHLRGTQQSRASVRSHTTTQPPHTTEKSDIGHSSSHHNHHYDHYTSTSERQPAYDPTAYTSTADEEKDVVWTPTCTQALKRQWQAVSLRIRFGVFRARRKMKTKLEGMF